jgi:hypothetical protein
MPVLLALAGFVVFLCVFGLRGLMIAGAVVGVLGVALYGLVIPPDRQGMAKPKPIAPIQTMKAGEPFCTPGPLSDYRNAQEREYVARGCQILSARGE